VRGTVGALETGRRRIGAVPNLDAVTVRPSIKSSISASEVEPKRAQAAKRECDQFDGVHAAIAVFASRNLCGGETLKTRNAVANRHPERSGVGTLQPASDSSISEHGSEG
jgi:hypothetical protein